LSLLHVSSRDLGDVVSNVVEPPRSISADSMLADDSMLPPPPTPGHCGVLARGFGGELTSALLPARRPPVAERYATESAEQFGQRVAETTLRWVRGKA